MRVKTRNNQVKSNGLETNHSFSIPKNIKNDINERWFHLYNWIWEKDVKQSIERDFLSIIKSAWPFISILLIVPAVLFIVLWMTPLWIWIFILWLIIINIILFIYLSILWIKRSNILRKNAHVLMTDSSISINWNIKKYSEFNNDEKEIKKISETFEEEIFKQSNIGKTKKTFMRQVMSQIWTWYKSIFKLWKGRSRNSWRLILILLALYSVYALSLWMIYFVWIFFIWIFGNILSIINKQIMLISWHKITSINSNFEKIDNKSKELIKEKNQLSGLLSDAMKNDWKDSLLIKINKWIEKINNNAENAVDTSINLKKEIKESKYQKMFNFSIYNSWIKNQIYIPLSQIVELLEKNLKILSEQKVSIQSQIKDTKDPSLSGPLVASKKRVEMRIWELKLHIWKMKQFISKLK